MSVNKGAEFNFPFEAYDIQMQLMRNIERVLEERKIGVFSSPTGTGKSLSLICATLTWLKNHRETQRQETVKALQTLNETLKAVEIQENDWIAAHSKKFEKSEEKLRLENTLQVMQQFDDRNKELKERQKSSVWISKKAETCCKKSKVIDKDEESCDDLLLNYESDDDMNEEKEEKCNTVKPMIIYCSRTHSQLSQFVSEVKATVFKDNVRLVTLGSRSNLCIHPLFSRLKDNNVLNEKCLDLQKKSSKCPYYKQTLINEVRDELLCTVHDIEDIAKIGKQVNACSYYASKSAALEAEILVVPYNVLLHKQTRKSYGIDLNDNIVIVDEAHNLLETISSVHSSFINGGNLVDCHSKLSQYLLRYNSRLTPKNLMYVKQLIFVISSLLKSLKPGTKNETEVMPTIEYVIKNVKSSEAVEKSTGDVNSGSSSLYPVIDFIRALTNVATDGRIVISRIASSVRESTLKFLLLNPSNQFKDIVDQARSIILIGGTMEPFSEFIDHLFKPVGVSSERIICFSCGHVIPDNNLLAVGLSCGPTSNISLDFSFKSRNDMKVILETGRVILKLCSVIPGGVILFFPSYEYEEKVHSVWLKNGFIKSFESTGKRVYREPKQSSCISGVLTDYKRSVYMAKGALLLSVVGGKMSEGINFSDDLGRAVIVIGLPFANITSPEIKEKMSFYNSVKSGEGQKYYLNACMKAVNQSIGRVIRHSRDYATIILLD
ncbi:Chl1p-like protein, partial [Leptotrombidium deliense]